MPWLSADTGVVGVAAMAAVDSAVGTEEVSAAEAVGCVSAAAEAVGCVSAAEAVGCVSAAEAVGCVSAAEAVSAAGGVDDVDWVSA